MHHIISSSVAHLAIPNSYTLSDNRGNTCMLQCHVFLPGWSTCVSVILCKLWWVQPIAMGLVLFLDVKEPGCSFDHYRPCSDKFTNTDNVG